MSSGPGPGAPTSRRRIREAVVQFLYAVDPAGELPDPERHPVLALLLEPLREKCTRARARAVLHLQQGRETEAAGLAPLVRQLALIDIADEDGHLAKAVRELDEAEASVAAALNYLRHELNGNKSAPRLDEGLEEARRSNLRSRGAAARISACDPTFPALLNIRKDALRVWKMLSEQADRLDRALARDANSRPELRSVAKAQAQVAEVAERIGAYLDGLRTHLPAIDRHLEDIIENYSPERIDRVDRAILRLAAYELLFTPEVPPGVAIDEAIELARAFGTTNSPRFVNGILDRLPKPASDRSK